MYRQIRQDLKDGAEGQSVLALICSAPMRSFMRKEGQSGGQCIDYNWMAQSRVSHHHHHPPSLADPVSIPLDTCTAQHACQYPYGLVCNESRLVISVSSRPQGSVNDNI